MSNVLAVSAIIILSKDTCFDDLTVVHNLLGGSRALRQAVLEVPSGIIRVRGFETEPRSDGIAKPDFLGYFAETSDGSIESWVSEFINLEEIELKFIKLPFF